MDLDYLNFEDKVPESLSREELYNLFKMFNEGSMTAREKIILHNIRIVLYVVNKKIIEFDYDKRELISIGIIGLIKAVDSYDVTKGYEFSTYAIKCINNEILMFMRKLKKECKAISIENVISKNKNDEELKIKDELIDDYNLEEESENTEIYKIIREIVDKLCERDREIIMLHFGFYDNHPYAQKEIANRFHISQSYVSRIIKKELVYIERILVEKDIIEKTSEKAKARKRNANK